MAKHNRNFIVFWILVLISCIIVSTTSSCASRKVSVEKLNAKSDSIVNTEVKVVTIENKIKTDSTNITTNIDSSEITITPIDSSKTILVDGKSYKNVVLNIKRSKTNSLYTNNKKEVQVRQKDSAVVTETKVKKQTTNKNKTIDKKANYWHLLYWLILISILYLLWRNKLWLLKRL